MHDESKNTQNEIDVPSESSRFPFVIPIIKYPIKLHPATVRA